MTQTSTDNDHLFRASRQKQEAHTEPTRSWWMDETSRADFQGRCRAGTAPDVSRSWGQVGTRDHGGQLPYGHGGQVTVGSLFSGIGGFDLGFKRAGFDIKWQVEIDDYANRVLAKHWPDVARYRDVREVCGAATLAPVDVVCGGFPCQPHSLAGRRLASADERDLWGEFARLIREIRPRWVVAENVSGLLSSEAGRFFGRVLGDLAACGYDAEWDCLPASAFGAPHRRDRVWLVAYPAGWGGEWRRTSWQQVEGRGAFGLSAGSSDGPFDVADTDGARLQERFVFTGVPGEAERYDDGENAPLGSWWHVEPNVGRVAHGIPARVDRLRGLGNAIVPQIAEWIARRILEAEGVAA